MPALNSFRFLQQAIEFEVRRQVEVIEDGGAVVQETRLYDPDRGETRSMRSKEDAQDYRYSPDPDLPPLAIDEARIERVRAELPELPEAMVARFESQYALPAYDARTLTASRELAAYYEATVAALGGEPKLAANWVQGEVAAALNRGELDIASAPVSAAALAGLLRRVTDGTISGKIGKDVFDAMWAGEAPPPNTLRASQVAFHPPCGTSLRPTGWSVSGTIVPGTKRFVGRSPMCPRKSIDFGKCIRSAPSFDNPRS